MLSDLRFRLRALFRRTRAECELDDELRFHLEQQIEKELKAGLTRYQAERAARLHFGGTAQVKESCREARGISLIETTALDLRYGLRVLLKTPAYTAVALLLLAVGIGVNTAVFSIANQVLLRGLAVREPGELLQLKADDLANKIVRTEFSYPAFEILSQPNPLIAGTLACSEPVRVNVLNKGVAGLATAVFESPEAPVVLGLSPALGRLSNAGDAKPSSETPPVFLSYAYWQKRFAGDPGVIGKSVTINSLPFVIAGVTPANFRGVVLGIAPDLTLPVYTVDAVRGLPTLHNRNSWGFSIICRRKPGITQQQIQAALMPAFARVLEDVFSGSPAAIKQYASKLKFRTDSASLGASSDTRSQLRPLLSILMVITGLVFLIACANLAGLTLAKTESRSTEIGMRLALGCSRGRLMRQLLTESALLAAMGGACGVLAAYWAGPVLLRVLGGRPLTEALEMHPDSSTLVFGFGLAILSGILLGITPALRAIRLDPQSSIGNSRTASRAANSRFGRLMIVTQLAASLVLSLTAGQFVRSLENYEHLDAGFRPDHLLTMEMRPDLIKYDTAQKIAFERRAYARLSELPGVKSVTFSTSTFGKLTWNTEVSIPGYRLTGSLNDAVGRNIVGPRFIETLGLNLVAGRDFDMRDNKDSPATVIVNESFARHFFGSTDVLGRQIFFIDSPTRPDTIIAVVRDARDRGVKEPPKPVVYSNYEHDPLGWIAFTVRVGLNPASMLKEIVSAIKQLDPRVPIAETGTAEAQLEEALQRERMFATLSAMLGTLATIVAMIGLYGLLAYSVTRRTREIGIRMALGARPDQVQWLAIKDGLALLLCGIAIGFPAYLAFCRILRGQVYGVSPDDPGALSMALGLLFLTAALATYLPAWRSTQVNPVGALKYE